MARGGARGQGPQLPKAMQSMLAESGASSSLKPHGGRYGSGSTLQKKRKKSAGQQQKPSVSSPRPSQSSSKNGKPQGKRKAPEPELETEKEPTTEPQRKAKKPKTALEKLAERQLNKSPDGMDKGRVKSVRKAATAAEAQEDLEIAWLESQLTRGPKAETDAVDDGLDDLLGDLDDVEAALGWRGGGKSIPSETIDAESESESEEDELDHLLEEDEEWDGISQHSKDSTEPALESESQHVPTSPETSTKQAYVPPHLRNKAIPQDTPASGPAQDLPPDARLDRQISSHLNKLSPQNLSNIQAALWALYSDGANGHFPRALVASSIVRLLLVRIDTRDSIGENQLLCFAALISGLKTIREGCVLESLKHFDAKTSVPQDEDDKSANNIVRFWARCYNLGAISCQFLYGLIRELVRRLGESDVEQLLALLKISGQQLRSDDPASLKEIAQLVQERANQIGTNELSSRTKFMIETLTNLKHNRPKALNGADSSLQGTEEQFKRHLKTWMRTASGASLDPIHVGLDELRQAESRGKWWVVGNAWAGDPLMEQQQKEDAQDASTTTGASHSQAKWLKLARKQGMNTTVRQSIFVALMGSEDYVDAVDRLIQLGLTEVQQREIIRVILHCNGHEKTYNPFYTLTMQRLLTLTTTGKSQAHSFSITLQYALWDLFREMGEESVAGAERLKNGQAAGVGQKSLSSRRVRNLSISFGWWFAKGRLPLSVLKPLPFYTLLPQSRDFLVQTLRCMLQSSQASSPLQFLQSDAAKPRRIDAQALEPVLIKVSTNPTVAQGLAQIIEEEFAESEDELENTLGQSALETLSLGRGIAADVGRLV